MTTENLSEEFKARLEDFFANIIDPKDMAKSIRRLNYIIALGIIRESETLHIEIDNIEDNYYWLNKLAEVLDPYLDAE
ncbi:hypothetical protein GKZ90_0008600 [Flavobacterium sp. MC2016-06]|jgi:hypothetical protein|uniref:hypothetical protein n=1 Tax=Flavobacterium sp. MC2016-06 TaxID=2676308 RepID=UPI0012BA8352|nr:hypothetical protein [Flavobacterium sp. MC2016-06]MBU3857911.1 hypothetical protein [Flavobacterium sp. MC2016-06]